MGSHPLLALIAAFATVAFSGATATTAAAATAAATTASDREECGAATASTPRQLVDACNYSFGDLFQAARKGEGLPLAPPTHAKAALDALYALPRAEINRQVGDWARQAGWYTEEQTGTDGDTFLAFSPQAKQLGPPVRQGLAFEEL